MSIGVDHYEIQLDRSSGGYWAGENVRGQLILRTARPVQCKGIYARFQGRARCKYTTGHKDKVSHEADKDYFDMRRTVWGGFYRTSIIRCTGNNAAFDQKTLEGELSLPVHTPPEDVEILVRVMGCNGDWDAEGDLLGEAVIDTRRLLSEPVPASIPLRREGRAGFGEATLSATLTGSPEERRAGALTVRVLEATGLRHGPQTHSHVFLQVYTVPRGTVDQGGPLPPPAPTSALPPGEVVFPFEFTLPSTLPPSAEFGMGRHSFVRYSVYSYVDVGGERALSARKVFTVLGTELPTPDALQPAVLAHVPSQVMYKCDCGIISDCCRCCKVGSGNVTMSVDRRALSPGDVVRAMLAARNDTEFGAVLKLELVANIRLCVPGRPRYLYTKAWELHKRPAPPHSSTRDDSPRCYTVPDTCASWDGDKGPTYTVDDPVQWRFELRLSLSTPVDTMTAPSCSIPVHVTAVPVSVLAQHLPQYRLSGPPKPYTLSGGEPHPVGVPLPGDLPLSALAAVPTAVSDQRDKATESVAHPLEDRNNWRGPPTFFPVYPRPEASEMPWPPPPLQCDWGGGKGAAAASGQPAPQAMGEG